MSSKLLNLSSAIALASAAAFAAPAFAQEELDQTETPQEFSEPDPVWLHEQSTLRLSRNHAGFVRGEFRQFDEDGYNIGVSFTDDASGSWADLYIYRAGIASVPMWGDRAASAMLSGGPLGATDLDSVLTSNFTPPNGAGEDSGYRLTAGLEGEVSATGLALYVHDGWLLKLRMSSRTLGPAELDARIESFIAALQLDNASQPASAFVPIKDCEEDIRFRRRARLMQLDMMASLLIGATISAAREQAQEQERDEQLWCRDGASRLEYGIYRNRGDGDSYTMAIGDSGTSLSVGRYDLGPLVNPSRGFLITQSDGVTELVYPPTDRLPRPELTAGFPGSIGPITSFDVRPGSDGGTTIFVSPE